LNRSLFFYRLGDMLGSPAAFWRSRLPLALALALVFLASLASGQTSFELRQAVRLLVPEYAFSHVVFSDNREFVTLWKVRLQRHAF
jgi:hypothetical protein